MAFGFLKSVIAPEVREVVTEHRRLVSTVPIWKHRLGIRCGHSVERQGTCVETNQRRALLNEERRLRTCGPPLLRPPQGRHQALFCSQDDKFWTTVDGTITAEIVKPRRSLWSSFR